MAMAKVLPCLWFDGNAEEAAEFYVTLLPNSHVDNVWRSPAETPSGPAGMILTVDFTVAGQEFQGLNGGPDFTFNESVSFVIECEDQAEVDRLWESLTANGGEPGPCGWLKDRFGLSWQIVPRRLGELVNNAQDGQNRGRRAGTCRRRGLKAAWLRTWPRCVTTRPAFLALVDRRARIEPEKPNGSVWVAGQI
jgi:predicted 3-demethylubiquinone-9 3-methyltransferase (glyoxalase superfamily)